MKHKIKVNDLIKELEQHKGKTVAFSLLGGHVPDDKTLFPIGICGNYDDGIEGGWIEFGLYEYDTMVKFGMENYKRNKLADEIELECIRNKLTRE